MKRASIFAALLLLALALGGTALAQSATVMTDQSDYAPGQIVTITGSGWQPGETVTLQFVESPLIDTPPNLYAVADASGNIFNNQFSPDSYDVNITFTLTATGNSSGLQAQTMFTDANNTTVSGTVKNGSTGVQGVTITAYSNVGLTILEGGPTNPTTSDSSGNWTLTLNKDTNTVYVMATSPSYNFTALTVGSGVTKDSNSEFHFTNANRGPNLSGNNFLVTPKTSSSTAVTSNSNPSTYGASVTFTANVTGSGPTPTGNVSFYDGGTCTSPGTQIGTQRTLSSGAASVSTAALIATTHTILACYGGDSTYAPSSGTVSQTVNMASTTTSVALTAGSNPSGFGSSLTFTATVTGTGATGTVAFWDQASGATCSSLGTSTQIGSTQTLSGGTASVSTTTLAAGSHTILACYSGDTDFSSSSGTISQTVNAAIVRRGQTIVATLSPPRAATPGWRCSNAKLTSRNETL